ncbi:MAG TPA: hypothetical protein VNM14_23450 [Planctomycetota bacterium]|jgi:hypothetical protein|nr:hypothetical protein [Planctomycetota bacterium]
MKILLSLAAVGMLAVVGCDKSDQKSVKDMAPKSTDLGTGLNAVEKSYARPAGEMSDVVAGVLQSFDLKLESTTHDDLGGEIVARRADGHKVTAKITARDEAACDVSIRVAPGNRQMADLIQERIGEKATGLPAK